MNKNYSNVKFRPVIVLLLAIISFMFTTKSYSQVNTAIPAAVGGGVDNLPLGTFFGFQSAQMQYSNAELVGAGLVNGSNYYISQVSFYLTGVSGAAASTPIKVFMKTSTGAPGLVASTITTALSTGYAQVYSGSLPSNTWSAGSWITINLTTPYYLSLAATRNLEIFVQTSFGGGGFGTGTSTVFSRTATGTNQFQSWVADGSPNVNNGVLSLLRPDVLLTTFIAGNVGCAPPGVGAVSATSDVTSVCAGTLFSVWLNGLVAPPYNNGACFTYQWQFSTTGAGGPWTNVSIVNPTGTTPVLGITQLTTTWYQCVISGVASTAFQVQGQLCYCAGGSTNTNDTDIGQVIFGAMTNPAAPGPIQSNPASTQTYSDFTGSVAAQNYIQGNTYPFSSTHITSGNTFYASWYNVFIDWNQDGTFDPAGEKVLSTGYTSLAAPTVNGNILIPFTAVPGITRMRVVQREQCCGSAGGPTNPPCGTFNWGEVEDYNIKVLAGPPCNVTSVGTATTSFPNVCALQAFTLSITGNVGFGSGMSFQWQTSPNGLAPWTNLAGANTYPWTISSQTATTWYRLEVICPTGGGTQYTTPVQVLQNPANLCLCVPPHPSCGSPFISNVTLATPAPNLSNATVCTNGNANAYTIYPSTGATTDTLVKGTPYTISVTTQTGNAIISVWFDWNANGVFEPSEHTQVATSNPSGSVATVGFTVPTTASANLYIGMRVRSRAAGSPNGAGDACTAFFSGEAEDYNVYIDPGVPINCNNAAIIGKNVVASKTNICSGEQVNFSINPTIIAGTGQAFAGVNHQWQISTAGLGGPYIAAPGINNTAVYSATLTQNTWVRDSISCSFSATSFVTPGVGITVSSLTWLGFTTDWADGQNWCGRVPTIVDNVLISKSAAVALGRPAADYKFPTAALRDSVFARTLTISNLDSMTVVTDTAVSFNVASDVINNGKLAVLSTAAADTFSFNVGGTNEGATTSQPFRTTVTDQVYQVIYNLSELLGSGLLAGDIIDSLIFNFHTRNSINPYENLKISYLQVPVTTTQFTSGNPITGAFTTIYDCPGSTFRTNAPPNGVWSPSGVGTGGWMRLGLLPGSFTWNGTDNIVLQICFNGTSLASTAGGIGGDNLTITTLSTKSAVFLSNPGPFAAANDGCSLTTTTLGVSNTFGASPSLKRPNITFKFRRPQTKLTANIGAQLQVSATSGKFWLSNTNLNIGSTFTNAGTSTVSDSCIVNIGGDLINDGSLTLATTPNLYLTGTVTTASSTITGIGSTTGVNIGDFVTGYGIPIGTKVLSLTATTIVMSNNATATGSVTFKTGAKRIEVGFNGSNWTNNGTFVPGTSRVTFGSNSVQTIGGTVASNSFFGLNIQKTSVADNITMSKPITVADSLVLRLGQLRLNKNLLNITNPAPWALSRYPVPGATPAYVSGSITLPANAVQTGVGSVATIQVGDLITGPGLSRTSPTHVVNITGTTVQFYPPALATPVAGTLSFYRSGVLVSEDSLSKVKMNSGNYIGYRVVQFANITNPAVPRHIPVTVNLTNGVDLGDVTYSTYKAALNAPLPPTVTHFNAAGPVTSTKTGVTTAGSAVITGVNPTAPVVAGMQVTGPGIPAGATVISVIANVSITISAPATVSSAGAALTGNITTGSNLITNILPSTTNLAIGQTITGVGIPAGSVISDIPVTGAGGTIRINTNATATTVAVALTVVNNFNYGVGAAAGTSDELYAADRFWILEKTGTTPSPSMEINFTFAPDERPCPSAITPFTCLNTISNRPLPQPWFVQTNPDLQGQWRRLATPFTVSGAFVTPQDVSNYNSRITNWDWSLGNYNPWSITAQNNPLPVELLSFDANLKGDDVLVEWSTASEQNNDYFTIERSLDLVNITEIAKVPSKGDSYDVQSYSTIDREPVKGAVNYYRLRQTDKDGPSEIVSEFVPVRIGLNSKFEIMYVKREGSVDVIFDYDSEAPISYTLFDITGRVIETGNNIPTQQGLNMLQLNSSNLSQGAYTIMIQNSTDLKTYKFVY